MDMPSSFTSVPLTLRQLWSDGRRQSRLLLRHLRFGRASMLPVPSPAKTAALIELFRVVNHFLHRSGEPYFITYGTLLGWYRGGRILPRDLDVDFGAPVSSYPALWAARHALPSGFAMYDTSVKHFGPKLYVTFRGWDADIYFYADDGASLRSLERSRNPGDVAPFPREFLYPLQPALMEGRTTWVPARPESLLTHIYHYLGDDGFRDPRTRYFIPRGRG